MYAPGASASGSGESAAYIVRFVSGTVVANEIKNGRDMGVNPSRSFRHVFPGFVANMNPAQVAAFERNPNVAAVEPDAAVYTTTTQSNATWGLDRVDQRALPLNGSYTYPNSGAVDVYVIDTGLRADHTEFTGRTAAGFDAVGDGNGTSDCNGHGTHVAGTIVGTTWGVAKGGRVIPVRVLGCSGSGTLSGVVAGLEWAVTHHQAGVPAVANMSLGSSVSSSVDTAVQALINDGVTVVVAAGNSNVDACLSSPARVPAAITVAAATANDAKASYSNYGSCVDLYAPGSSITSAANTSTTGSSVLSGTSMAAPHVAGAVAVLLAANPTLTPAAVGNSIVANASPNVITSNVSGTPNRQLFVSTSATTTVSAPAAPTSVTATPGSRRATVSWIQGSNNGSALTGHTIIIYQGTTRVGSVVVAASASSAVVTGLKSGQTYNFRVSATNALGTSPLSTPSNSVTVLR